MSIASEITRLQNSKGDIKTSIEAKGVTVPTDLKLDGYSACIDAITVGGGYKIYAFLQGGGGGGGDGCGRYGGGGGGGGGYNYGLIETEGAINIKIGNGGLACTPGGDSVINSNGACIVAPGGGPGLNSNVGGMANCKRGGCTFASSSVYLGGLQCNYGGGGGAGMQGVGGNGCYYGGCGGNGHTITGKYLGGGGGGGAGYANSSCPGGTGKCGGGNGGKCATNGCNATACGGGGGGGGGCNGAGGCGAGGQAFIRYPADGSWGISNGVGGNKYECGGYCYHRFKSDGVFVPLDGCYVDVLMVGPGGGGCLQGGGGGEVLCLTTIKANSNSIGVTVGGTTSSWLMSSCTKITNGSSTLYARGGHSGTSGNGNLGVMCGAGGGAGGAASGANGGPGLYGYGGGGANYGGTATDGGGAYGGNATACGGGGGYADGSGGTGGGGRVEICYPADGSYGFTTATGGTKTSRTVDGVTFYVHQFNAGSNTTFTITG